MGDQKKQLLKKGNKTKPIFWVLGFFAICGALFYLIGKQVYDIDPFFHYRAPDTEKYFYELNSERNQNDGILRNFDYDALIIGTSMAQNFKPSEFDEIFGVHSIKTTFAGSSFRETGDRLRRALKSNDQLKTVIRSLDMDFFYQDYDTIDAMASGDYPEYLYDDNTLNDYQYLLNRDIIFGRVYEIKKQAKDGETEPGITSFDTYDNWMGPFWGHFGVNSILEEDLKNYSVYPYGLYDSDKWKIKRNITYNFIDIATEYPDVEFYLFIPPYSAVWWNINLRNGVFLRQLQAEQYILELLLPYDNIHVFSYNNNLDLTTDLNNYKDSGHYGEWVNSAMLTWMKNGIGLLTEDNYLEYIRSEYNSYGNYDFTKLRNQTDYEDDKQAAEYIKYLYYYELYYGGNYR